MKYLMNINEMFDRFLKTDYQILKNDNGYKIMFKTRNHEYRLDLTLENRIGKVPANHIAFSDANVNDDAERQEYDKLTKKGEMLEIISRISYILKDLVNKGEINNKFCIGGTIRKRNKIYSYILDNLIGKYAYTKEETELYPSGWGYYFEWEI